MAYQFGDSPFLSARDKRLVLEAWVRFLKRGPRFEDFSDRLYKHLINRCSFIAHYDRAGFYAKYFERGEDTIRFLSQFDGRGDCRSVEYGFTGWLNRDYEDIDRAMIAEATRYIPSLMESCQAKQRQSNIFEARQLLSKDGIQLP